MYYHIDCGLAFIHTLAGGADEDQVMDCRNKLAQTALFPHDILIAHGYIVFNARCIQVILEKKLSAIGNAIGRLPSRLPKKIPTKIVTIFGVSKRFN